MIELAFKSINISILILASFLFFKLCPPDLKKFYWPALLVKLLCGILYGLLYRHYYDYGDTFSYFSEAVKIADVGRNELGAYIRFLLFNENENSFGLSFSSVYHVRSFWMVKVVSPFLILTNNNYWLTTCYFSLFSFLGIFYLVSTLNKIYPGNKVEILISFLAFPSFVFWSSGLTKESLAIGSLFFLLGVVFRIVQETKITVWEVLLVPLLFYLEWKIRVFYLAVLILTIGVFLIYHYLSKSPLLSRYKWVIISVSVVVSFVVITQMDYALNFSNFLDSIIYAYNTNYGTNPSNAIHFPNLSGISSIIIYSPYALVSGLFRPFVFDAQTWPMIIVGIENLILLIFFLSRIPYLKKTYHGIEIALWFYIFILAVFLALSTPNFGTLTRYKVAFLPIFLFLLVKENPVLQKYRISKKP